MDVEEAIQEYLATLKRLQPKTVQGYEQRLGVFCQWVSTTNKKKIADHLKQIQLEQVNVYVVDAFVQHLEQTHKPHKAGVDGISTYTLVGYVQVIKSFLSWCLVDEEYSHYVKPDVIKRIKLPKLVKVLIETFNDEHLAAMRKACHREYNDHLRLRDECILSMLICTGIRAFELCGLTIANTHLDPKESYIKVFGKGQKWREVPLDDKCRRQLKIYLKRYRAGALASDPVFITRSGSRALTVNGLEKLITRLAEWANIEGVRCSPHTFRHTYAVTFMKQIGDIYLLSKTMGHSSVRVTEDYLKSFSGKEVRLSLLRRMNNV